MYKIDLNCDLGESTFDKPILSDEKIISLITSANIACGFHAGSPTVMKNTVELCKRYNVNVGAHPSFYDRENFGRKQMDLSYEDIKNLIIYQVSALNAFCNEVGVKLNHVKPHGALYNLAAKDEKIAKAIVEGVKIVNPDLILMGLSGSVMLKVAKSENLKIASEVFADRAYEDDGSLVARSKQGAMIENEDEAVSRVIKMIKTNKVTSINGKEIDITPDTVCVHGDGEKALLFVQKIKNALNKENIEIGLASR